MLQKFPLFIASILSIGTYACAVMDSPTLAGVPETSIDFNFKNSKSLTVVFESGLGDGIGVWDAVLKRLPDAVSTFTYSRPGYGGPGYSSAYRTDGDGKRTGAEIATHLRSLLRQAGAPPPYILVGHSIGGPYVLSYALSYPDEVAGIILVDGRPPDFTESCKLANAGLCEPPALVTAIMPPHQRAEVHGLGETYLPFRQGITLTGIPLTVITATEPDVISSTKFQKLWLKEQQHFAERHNAKYVEAIGSTHYIQKKRPELVVKEILSMGVFDRIP